MLAVGYHCDMLNWMCAVVNLLLLLYFVVLLQILLTRRRRSERQMMNAHLVNEKQVKVEHFTARKLAKGKQKH